VLGDAEVVADPLAALSEVRRAALPTAVDDIGPGE
jgi:hypothetical protein